VTRPTWKRRTTSRRNLATRVRSRPATTEAPEAPPLPRSASGVSSAVAETYHAIEPAFAPISRVMASSGTAQ